MKTPPRWHLERLRTFARNVAGDSRKTLVDILTGHLAVDLEGVVLAENVVRGTDPTADTETEIRRIEHRGDQFRQRLVAELAQTLVTPLDREDLFRLSRSIDDVLDNTRDFIREWSLYRPDSARNLASLLEVIGSGITELSAAVGAIGARADRSIPHLLEAKRIANRVRRRFEHEVAELLNGKVTPEVLKHRELLRRLDVVGLRLGEAVDTLFDALVKRGGGLSLAPSDSLSHHRRGARWLR